MRTILFGAVLLGTLSAAPPPVILTLLLPNGTVGADYSQDILVLSGVQPFHWSVTSGLLPGGLTIDPSLGRISGTPNAAGTFTFTVRVVDDDGKSDTQTLSVTVNAAALVITSNFLAAGTVGVPYAENLTAVGGSGGYTWVLMSGSLPAGLTLSTAGAITGTPNKAGTENFTVRVMDSSQRASLRPVSIQIVVAPLVITTSSLAGATVESAYSQALAASGGTGGNVWTMLAGTLPAGLSLANDTIAGTPSASGTRNFTVQVKDSANTTATKALSIAVAAAPLAVTTSALPKGTVGVAYSQALAASGGAGGNTWSVISGALPGNLSMSAAGVISGTPGANGTLNFSVQVRDSANVTATKALAITIDPAALVMTTSALPKGTVGVAYSQALGASGGAGGNTWSVISGALPANLSLSAAGVISGTPGASGTSNFTVQVRDSANITTTRALAITIDPAALVITTSSLPNGTVGVAYSQALGVSGGSGGSTWSVVSGALPGNLSLSAAGVISGTPGASGTSNFTVQVRDSANITTTRALAITIDPAALVITTSSLPNGTVGVAYSQALGVSGGSGGSTWSVVSGALPGNLSLSAAGLISGTPGASGTSNFTVQVRDSANITTTRALAITIDPAALVITTSSLPNGTVGVAYSQALGVSGGSGGSTWSVVSGALPGNLSLSAAGLISGTPGASGTSNFTVQVRDSANITTTRALAITIDPAALVITTSSLPNGTVNAAYSQALTASGGRSGNTWSVSAGALPGNLSLSGSGTISGTPGSNGTSTFTVQVRDSANVTATKALAITVDAAGLVITTSSLPNGTFGAVYSQTLAANGGTGGNIWTVATGTPPGGLQLSAGGIISGTPNAAGTSSFTVQVKDSANTIATKALAITVDPAALTVTTSSLPNGTVSTAYSQTLAASGGTGGNTWSVSAGTFPGGLQLSAGGIISGTPNTAGTSSFTVQVKDSANTIATKALAITVDPAALTVTTSSLPNGTVTTAYSQTLAASGGTGGNTWSVSAGTFPGGLQLSAGGIISGTPNTAGTSSFTVQVKDSANAIATKALAITVDPAALTVTTSSLPNGTVSTAYSQTLAASGGTGGNTWSVSAGTLPGGLQLSAGGIISGTPNAAGTSSFTVQVKDSANATATKALAITVDPAALTVTTSSLPNGTVSTAYSQTLAASGGTGGNTWSVSAGTLPGGLQLSAGGIISGTPNAAGTSSFTVQVKDSANATATKALAITVDPAGLVITTSSLPNGTLGAVYSQTLAASGGTGGNTWIVATGALPGGLGLSAGGTISGTPNAAGNGNFTVQVKDSANTTATKALVITVDPAALTVTTSSLPNGTVNTAYSQTLAAGGGTGGNAWSISAGALPDGLSLNGSGTISGKPNAAGNSNFTVQVKDSANTTATKALVITVDPAALTVTTSSLPNGTVNAAYSQTLATGGGTGGNTWSVSAGTLPGGLGLSAEGIISGTPTAAGNSSFTVQVKDSANATATKALAITVDPAALTVTTSSLPNGTVNTVYSQTLAAGGGTGGNAWSISAGALPDGLSLGGSGTISGTPTAAGTSSFTVQVKDSSNTTSTKALAVTVDPAALTVTTSFLPNGTVNTAYSQALAASGGTGGNAWSVSAGALPGGLSLSSSGNISGTPTAAGTSSFTVQVKDSANTTVTKALAITVDPATLTITTSSLPNGTVNTVYSQTLAAGGGAGGNAWSVSSGTLPAGLSLNGSGTISGTPTTVGNSSFTVQVRDSANTTVTKALTIGIDPAALTVTTPSLPNGSAGTSYSETLAASGGTGTNTWSISAGALPAGLSLSGTGTISGTPTSVGSSSFTVQVKDSANTTASKALSITITPPALVVTTASLPNGTIGAAYSQSLGASGGSGGNQWSVSAGALPAGLSMSAAGVISGTPTTAAISSFTAQVADSAKATAAKPLSITIAAAAIVITTATLPNAAQGSGYSQMLAASGGSGGYRWSVTSGSLPAGLALDNTGRIAGIPTGQTSTFTVQAMDFSGTAATRNFTITVAAALTFSSPATLPGGVVGVAYSTTVTVTGGTPPYTFAVISGLLPGGLSLNAPTGLIAGTPTLAGSYTFTLQVTDSAGASSSGPFGVAIRPPLAITTAATLANGSVGALFRQVLAAAGGVPPYTWSVVTGPLPTGIALNAGTGELSGTPSQAGAFPITVQVRDSAGTQVQARLSLTVANGLTITTPPVLPAANLGRAYQVTLESAGGAAPYIWSVNAGALPPGLTFRADGKIDGTATTAGSFNFTALVVDGNSSRATKEFTIAVAGALTITSASALPGGVTGSAYTATLAATGGTPPFVFTVSAGSTPPGLTLEAPTGVLVGTPTTTGTFDFTVTLTDAANLTAQKAFTVTIAAGLTFATPGGLPGATAGTRYSATIRATGGQPPYSYRVSSGALPDGLSLNASSGEIAGTPGAGGTFNFTVEATDAAPLTASRVYSIVVGLPSAPALGIASVPATLSALQQPVVDLTSDPYPVAITGRLNLRFIPANGMPDDPAVQFSSGGRSANFTIPANATHATFASPQFAIQAGSVAGTIEFTVESLDAGGSGLPAPAGAVRSVQVAAAAPVIRSVAVNRTAGGFEVAIVGLSTTREVTQAKVSFRPSAGSNLQTQEVTVPLTDAAKAWYASGGSAAYGGQFTLTLPFSIVGGTNVLDSVMVVLVNGVGGSAEAGAAY